MFRDKELGLLRAERRKKKEVYCRTSTQVGKELDYNCVR